MENIVYHNQVGFILGRQVWFNIKKSVNVIHQNSRIKEKKKII